MQSLKIKNCLIILHRIGLGSGRKVFSGFFYNPFSRASLSLKIYHAMIFFVPQVLAVAH
jgi:hypothetical protein